ncbi:MAG: 30S ribosomal protein S9 [Candidatus Pacearchaeota archaeon]
MQKNIITTGKRKRAIAKATIKEGKGNVFINRKKLEFFPWLNQLEIKEPLMIAKEILKELNFDIYVNVKGGGISSQTEATRLAIAKAIVAYTKNDQIRRAYLSYDKALLVADTRRNEPHKPRDSKARAKRQKSYR